MEDKKWNDNQNQSQNQDMSANDCGCDNGGEIDILIVDVVDDTAADQDTAGNMNSRPGESAGNYGATDNVTNYADTAADTTRGAYDTTKNVNNYADNSSDYAGDCATDNFGDDYSANTSDKYADTSANIGDNYANTDYDRRDVNTYTDNSYEERAEKKEQKAEELYDRARTEAYGSDGNYNANKAERLQNRADKLEDKAQDLYTKAREKESGKNNW